MRFLPKKLFLFSFIFLLLLSPAGFKSAQGDISFEISFALAAGTVTQAEHDACVANNPTDWQTKCFAVGSLTSTPGTAQVNPDDSCGVDTPSICISNIVYAFTAGIMSVFAYIGGYIFSLAVQISLNSYAYAQGFLSVGWATVRDIANVAFIFVLLYIAFTVMFKAETAGTYRTLAMVILMALLINFSFFITRVIIDGGNILAVQFYNQIQAPSLDQGAAQNGSVSGAGIANTLTPANTKDLTASIMQVVHIQNILSTPSFQAFNKDQNTGFLARVITLSLIYIAVGIMFGILASTFFFAGFKFVYRVAILWVVIIGAPFAFVARAIPNKHTERFYKEWQSHLIMFSFYPAIFLFIFLIINYVLLEMARATGGNFVSAIFQDITAANALSGSNPSSWVIGRAIASMALRLGIVVVLLYFGLRIADTLVKRGNDAAASFTGWMGRRLGDLTYGTVARVARPIGSLAFRGAAGAASTRAAASSGIGRTLWSGVARGSRVAASGSYDARGISTYTGGIKQTTGLDVGRPAGGWILPNLIKGSSKPTAPKTVAAVAATAANPTAQTATQQTVLRSRTAVPPPIARPNETTATTGQPLTQPPQPVRLNPQATQPRGLPNRNATPPTPGSNVIPFPTRERITTTDSRILKLLNERRETENQTSASTRNTTSEHAALLTAQSPASPAPKASAAIPPHTPPTPIPAQPQQSARVSAPYTVVPSGSSLTSKTSASDALWETKDYRKKALGLARQQLVQLRTTNKGLQGVFGFLTQLLNRPNRQQSTSRGPLGGGPQPATQKITPVIELKTIEVPSLEKPPANDAKKSEDKEDKVSA